MILKMFTVFDQVAKIYLRPFFSPELGQATRSFADCANDKSHEIGRNPSDYTLFHIGEFDESTSIVTYNDQPQVIGTAVQYVNRHIPTHPQPLDLDDQATTD